MLIDDGDDGHSCTQGLQAHQDSMKKGRRSSNTTLKALQRWSSKNRARTAVVLVKRRRRSTATTTIRTAKEKYRTDGGREATMATWFWSSRTAARVNNSSNKAEQSLDKKKMK